jgi:hypothetical protein
MKPIKKSDSSAPWAVRDFAHKKKRNLNKDIQISFRIYCEGVNTEPNYFKSFPLNTDTTEIFSEGYGRQKTALVNHVLELLKKDGYLSNKKEIDPETNHFLINKHQIWIVFDYDIKREYAECQDFKSAISLAEKNFLNVAYSNDAFELWFLLHFQFLDGALHRNVINEKLDDLLPFKYSNEGKRQEFSKKIYKILLEKQKNAIKNAENLLEKQKLVDLCNQNPVTKVHLLVKELNKYIRK